MAGAYASLLSLKTVIDNLQNHPSPPIPLHQQQLLSLIQKLSFLQEFLQVYSNSETWPTDALETDITDVVHGAEDAIETRIVDQIGRFESSSCGDVDLYRDLQKIIQRLDSITKQALEIREKVEVEDQQHMNPVVLSAVSDQKSIMVGFGNVLNDLLDKLTGRGSSRLIIPIVGMGGIGKTTLALNAYDHAYIKEHFHIRVWVTISQNFQAKEILSKILSNFEDCDNTKELEELGEEVHKQLFGRTYLIIMDDMWSSEAWDEIGRFFPDNNNGSRVVITTRDARVATQLSGFSGIKVDFLGEDESWNLFCKTTFKENTCPLELEKIGKTIARNCKGLPLSIVVIGGLLARSEQTKQHWEFISKNLSSFVNLENDKHCLKILQVSYRQLPIHLKPCFLYMGMFPEDFEFRISDLVKLLVAEGFLKPVGGKSMEVVAEDYIKDLVDRNLILIVRSGLLRKIKLCKIHDLLRDLCLREVWNQNFLYVIGKRYLQNPESINMQCRIVVNGWIHKQQYSQEVLDALDSASLVHSSISISECVPIRFRLLRVVRGIDQNRSYGTDKNADKLIEVAFQFYNSRYLNITFDQVAETVIPSSISLLWNLQTLVIKGSNRTVAPIEMWNMPHLRHLIAGEIYLPNPPHDNFVLKNLQTLSRIGKFRCSEEVICRIQNIKKLDISVEESSNCCLNNLEELHKLEKLNCMFRRGVTVISFPGSLKKLDLWGSNLRWEDVSTKIGPLPRLEEVRLSHIKGPVWRPVEGQFLCLKSLCIRFCPDLECWEANSVHFRVLVHLSLSWLNNLREIPSGIGDILTLQLIEVIDCSNSVVGSVKRIAEEQDEVENHELQVTVKQMRENRTWHRFPEDISLEGEYRMMRKRLLNLERERLLNLERERLLDLERERLERERQLLNQERKRDWIERQVLLLKWEREREERERDYYWPDWEERERVSLKGGKILELIREMERKKIERERELLINKERTRREIGWPDWEWPDLGKVREAGVEDMLYIVQRFVEEMERMKLDQYFEVGKDLYVHNSYFLRGLFLEVAKYSNFQNPYCLSSRVHTCKLSKKLKYEQMTWNSYPQNTKVQRQRSQHRSPAIRSAGKGSARR